MIDLAGARGAGGARIARRGVHDRACCRRCGRFRASLRARAAARVRRGDSPRRSSRADHLAALHRRPDDRGGRRPGRPGAEVGPARPCAAPVLAQVGGRVTLERDGELARLAERLAALGYDNVEVVAGGQQRAGRPPPLRRHPGRRRRRPSGRGQLDIKAAGGRAARNRGAWSGDARAGRPVRGGRRDVTFGAGDRRRGVGRGRAASPRARPPIWSALDRRAVAAVAESLPAIGDPAPRRPPTGVRGAPRRAAGEASHGTWNLGPRRHHPAADRAARLRPRRRRADGPARPASTGASPTAPPRARPSRLPPFPDLV